jgi:hypothetical protein
MSKTYDRVEWEFLKAAMYKMGFAGRWIQLIMMCVRTANYAILINGNTEGRIYPSRGIRQGDPISPYLFLICVEALCSLLTKADQDGSLKGVPTSRRGPRINHLFFADDSLLFSKADESHWRRLTCLLSTYEKASGQRLNREKMTIFFSINTTEEVKEKITELSRIPVMQRYDMYLGLLALVGKSRNLAFQGIKDRVWKMLQDWKLKFLSQAGKEILFKAVIQVIPIYSMSVFLLPKTLCLEINYLMQKFWWGHQANESKIHWMSWSRMGLPKNRGGMGFQDLHCFNQSLLAKQCWRLWKIEDSLIAQIMKAKYYPDCSVLDAQVGTRVSYAWRSIQSSCQLLKKGLIWRVGNGNSVKVWGSKWVPIPTTYEIQTPPRIIAPDSSVSVLIDRDQN